MFISYKYETLLPDPVKWVSVEYLPSGGRHSTMRGSQWSGSRGVERSSTWRARGSGRGGGVGGGEGGGAGGGAPPP